MDAVNPLNYAPRPRAAQRVWRWAYRLIFVAAIVIAAVQWSPAIWRRAQSIYWEQKCLSFVLPPEHVVFEIDGSTIIKSELTKPLNRFEGIHDHRYLLSDGGIFLHEMRRPDGARCLVALTCWPIYPNGVTSFRLEVMQWTISLLPRLNSWNYVSFEAGAVTPRSHWKFFAGQPDSNNPSHFAFDYELDGTRHTCDGWLNNVGQLIVSQRP